MLPAAIVCAAVFVASMGAFAATTYTWRGGGADANWSTAENWSPNGVPTKDDIVVFDGESGSGTILVDEGLAAVSGYAAVSECQLTSGFAGTLQIERPLCVQKTFTQDAGTVVCGTNFFRLGSLTTRDYSQANKHGCFYLNGGTFNAPSSEFQYFTVSHQVNFEINGGTWNHNNGTFINETSCGGGTMSFKVRDQVFNNVVIRRAPKTSAITSQIFSTISTNTVLGDFTLDAGQFTSKDSVWIVKGNVTVSGVANGGNAAILLNGEDEQTVTALDGKGKSIGLIVDKPEDSWVRFVGGNELVFNMDAQTSGSGYHGLEWIGGGGLDFSGVTGIRFNCYHTHIYFPPKEKVVLPATVTMVGYQPQPKCKDFEFTNLTCGTYDSRLDFGNNVTNTVRGDLKVTGGGLSNASSVLLVHGDYRVDDTYKPGSSSNNGGGNGWVVLCGEGDQAVSVTNSTCNSLRIDKPEGSTVTVDSPDGCLWLGHRGTSAYIAGEGSLDMRGGILDVSRGGIIMTNGHAGTLKQTGGRIRWGERGLYTYILNSGHNYAVNFGDEFMIPRYEAAGAKGGGGNSISCTLSVSNFVNSGATINGTVKVYGDHYVHADTKAIIKENLAYCGDADQRVFAEEGVTFTGTSGRTKSVQKTGGVLTLDSDLKVSSWDGDTFTVSATSSIDMNGHTLETPGDISLTGRAMFTGGGQLKAGRVLYVYDKATIAFDLPTEPDNAPFLYGTNVYFDRGAKAFTNTIEVLSKARRASISPVTFIATGGNKFYNAGGGGLNREPVWQYVLPINVVRPQASVYAAEGRVDFTWLYKCGRQIILR